MEIVTLVRNSCDLANYKIERSHQYKSTLTRRAEGGEVPNIRHDRKECSVRLCKVSVPEVEVNNNNTKYQRTSNT